MSEITDYDLIRSEIASFIGTPSASWDTRTSTDVTASIRKGIQSVVHNAASHQWTWMRPTHRFKTVDGQRQYTLPIDFEQFIDHLVFDGEDFQYPAIIQKPSPYLQQMDSERNSTGTPFYFAIEVESHDGTTQHQQQIVLHPVPDREYQLAGIYQVGPIRSLSTERPWLPGGPEFTELFIAACLAATESKFMDGMLEKHAQFQIELQAAIRRDYSKQARNLGPLNPLGRSRRYSRDYYRHRTDTTYKGGQDL